MTVYKISEDYYEHSYTLLAIHCSLEDYRLAYLLNAYLHIHLKKAPDLNFNEEESAFSLYEWEDYTENTLWSLIANSARVKTAAILRDDTLFDANMPVVKHLIPEKKQIDYFLKIEALPEEDVTSILQDIQDIPQIVTAYMLDADKLKSKRNLIL